MSRATDALMDTLHQMTAETLTKIIKEGVTVLDKEGNQVQMPAPAAYIAAAIKFLKDNDITADAAAGRTKPLADAVSNIPTFDDGDDYPDEYAKH